MRLQRLYKMCLVIVCFFLISANCIFWESGPEPQRERQKENTQEKNCSCETGEAGGRFPSESSCGLLWKQTWVRPGGRGLGVLGTPLYFQDGREGGRWTFRACAPGARIHPQPLYRPSGKDRSPGIKQLGLVTTVTNVSGDFRFLNFDLLICKMRPCQWCQP